MRDGSRGKMAVGQQSSMPPGGPAATTFSAPAVRHWSTLECHIGMQVIRSKQRFHAACWLANAVQFLPSSPYCSCAPLCSSCCRAWRLAHIQDFLVASAVCALPYGLCTLQAAPGLEAGPRSNSATSPTDVSDVDLGGLLLDVEASMPLPGVHQALAGSRRCWSGGAEWLCCCRWCMVAMLQWVVHIGWGSAGGACCL